MALNSQALTTVARYKAHAGITGAGSDTKIEVCINVATDLIERFCDRRFLQTTYANEVYDGQGSDRLMLKQYPVSERNAFQLDERDTVYNQANWSSVDTTVYFIDYTAGILELIGRRFMQAPRHYQVSYTAGYAFDNTTPGATLESLGIGDLEWACWQLVTDLFKNAASPTGINSESIGNYSVSYGGTTSLNDPLVKTVLLKYQRPHLN